MRNPVGVLEAGIREQHQRAAGAGAGPRQAGGLGRGGGADPAQPAAAQVRHPAVLSTVSSTETAQVAEGGQDCQRYQRAQQTEVERKVN